MNDLEGLATFAFMIAAGLAVVGLLVLFGIWIAHVAGEWSAESDCRDRGGKVEYYDQEHQSLWRCASPTPERAP